MRNKIGWGLMTFLSLGIVLVASRYLTFNPAVFFPEQRTVYLAHTAGIVTHVVGGMLALGLGPFQFLSGLRTKHPTIHRWIGRVYLVGVLIGGIAALYMATFAYTGAMASLGFGALALLAPALAQPGPAKELRTAFLIAESGFDPAQVTDLYSNTVVAGIFEAPLEYAFLAKPTRMRPNTAAAMPEVSADFRTFTFRIEGEVPQGLVAAGADTPITIPAQGEELKPLMITLPEANFKEPFKISVTLTDTKDGKTYSTKPFEFAGPDPRAKSNDYLDPKQYLKQ